MMIGYIISSQDMSVADMENAVYASYEEPIVLDKNGEYIIYVMIVDGGMNIRYLRYKRNRGRQNILLRANVHGH